jgi:predicted phosphodiesterase
MPAASGGRRATPAVPDEPQVPQYVEKTEATDANLLVAFIGDQGNNEDSDAVLGLIRAEGAAATVHNGDFDYEDNPDAWVERIDRILGANYPYFAIVGNHDAPAWTGSGGYAEKIRQRHSRVAEMSCEGEVGVRAQCNFRGLHIIQSCVGVNELRAECQADRAEQVDFIDEALKSSNAIWSICAWHKNQHDMQVGGKSNEVGWMAYQACMRGGGIVITGHEHSYSRTLSLTDIGNEENGHGKGGAFDIMNLGLGSTFVVVSGLAGRGIRNYIPSSHDDDTWWSSYFAADAWLKNGQEQPPSPAFGALFIEFNIGGDPRRARGYFKTTAGRIIDEFIISRN